MPSGAFAGPSAAHTEPADGSGPPSKALSLLGLAEPVSLASPPSASDDSSSIRTRSSTRSSGSSRPGKLLRTPSFSQRSHPPLPEHGGSYVDLAPSPGAAATSFAHPGSGDYMAGGRADESARRMSDRRPSTATDSTQSSGRRPSTAASSVGPATLPPFACTRFDLTSHVTHSSILRRYETTIASTSFLKRVGLGGGSGADHWPERRITVSECGLDAALHVFKVDAGQLATEMDRLRLTPRSLVTVTVRSCALLPS